MTRLLVPYHLDEQLPDLDVPVASDATITCDLRGTDVWSRLAHLFDTVATSVAGTVDRQQRPLVISGDCTTSLGTVSGLQRAGVNPSIVWFEAHGDVQTLETSETGYVGGLPLRILVGYRPDLIGSRLGLRPVPEQDVVLVDARDLDTAEVDYLDSAAIRRSSVRELDGDRLPDGPVYLHVDLDVIDSGRLPGLRVPAPDGPDTGTVTDALARVIATGRVCAIGLACTWYPGHDAARSLGAELESLLASW